MRRWPTDAGVSGLRFLSLGWRAGIKRDVTSIHYKSVPSIRGLYRVLNLREPPPKRMCANKSGDTFLSINSLASGS